MLYFFGLGTFFPHKARVVKSLQLFHTFAKKIQVHEVHVLAPGRKI